jgi:feruloyl esterase
MQAAQHSSGRRRARWYAGALLISLAAALLALSGAASRQPDAASRPVTAQDPLTECSAGAIQALVRLAGVTVVSALPVTGGSYVPPGSAPITGLPAFCAAALTQADSAGNLINVEAWLPADWNGRFEGVGGMYYSCGISYSGLAGGIEGGYATASTDCGVPLAAQLTGQWGLTSSDTLNWPLIDDFAYAGIHDMSVAGKAVTAGYYARAPRYSYFSGCSTGGREALMEAQRYPGDYNGIVAGAPAINWTQFVPSELWPELVMKESSDYLPSCKENAFTEAIVKACGNQDGTTSPFIADPAACQWSPERLIGHDTPCGTITATDARVMEQIWAGPPTSGKKLWYGLEPGASLTSLAGTVTTNGVTTPTPFSIPLGWFQNFLKRDPSWNWQTLTYSQFNQLFAQSVSEFSPVMATNNPDLSQFKKDGGKILIWHGLADQLIFPQGSINYYQRVQQKMGGARQTASFARLFLAPGAQHCASAAGPAPASPLAAVVNWVEHGEAPTSILATATDPAAGPATPRPLCAYPATARYAGHGSPDNASNFHCTTSKT